MHRLLLALGVLRAPIIAVLFGIVVLAIPQQTHEIFEAIGQETGAAFIAEVARASLFILLFGLVLIATSVALLETTTPYRNDAVTGRRRFLEALAMALPISVLLGVAIAAIDMGVLTKRFPVFDQNSSIGRLITWRRFLLGGAGGVFSVTVAALMRFDGVRASIVGRVSRLLAPLSRLTIWWVLVLLVLVLVLLNAAILIYPRAVTVVLGPIGVLFLFLSVLTATLAVLGYIYDRFQVPVLAVLIAAAFVWAYIPTNDNHEIRLLARETVDRPEAADAFKEWLRQRPDLADYKDKPYPVYIITAEGGGLYAAAHAAWTLAKIQDNCPAFARHVFAISSVSGGSLGAALFAALVKAYPQPFDPNPTSNCHTERDTHGPMQLAVKKFFAEDFLTPLLGAALFPDLVQRLWPWGIATLDRARALEDAFELAWRKTAPLDNAGVAEIFSRSSRELWSAKEDQPALLLNTTHVQSGERVVIAPFKLRELNFRPFIDRPVDLLNEKRYITPLKTAVGISARFPLVTRPRYLSTMKWGFPPS
jgi:hypothetical protein